MPTVAVDQPEAGNQENHERDRQPAEVAFDEALHRLAEAKGAVELLLAAGTTILTLAFRSEREFKRARELFLTGATHELKTPLTAIRALVETMEDDGGMGQDTRQRFLGKIRDAYAKDAADGVKKIKEMLRVDM